MLNIIQNLSPQLNFDYKHWNYIQCVEDEDWDELDHAVECHVFKDTKRCDKSTSSFANDNGNATDVRNPKYTTKIWRLFFLLYPFIEKKVFKLKTNF